MEKTTLQGKLDVQKWLESEHQNQDLCGNYEYCAYCDPAEEFPCAEAYTKCEEIKTQNAAPAAPHVAPIKIKPAKPAPKKAAPKATAPKTAAPKTAAPKTTAPKATAPKTTAPKTTAPKTTAPKATAPKTTTKK